MVGIVDPTSRIYGGNSENPRKNSEVGISFSRHDTVLFRKKNRNRLIITEIGVGGGCLIKKQKRTVFSIDIKRKKMVIINFES